MIYDIVKYPNDLLLTQCKPVVVFDKSLANLCHNMVSTMRRNLGVGLAAPQVGVLQRIFVAQIEDSNGYVKYLFAINPKILSYSRIKSIWKEGCLSFDTGYSVEVLRPDIVEIEYYTPTEEKRVFIARGLMAHIFQHEIEHLDGILINQYEG